jgi:hypothetical protein
MKNIAILILFLLFSTQGTTLLAQANTQKIGSPNVTSIIQGGLQADSAFRAPFLPKNYNYTKGQTTFRQLILATEDSSLYINRGDVQTKIFTQRDTNTAYGPTTPFYVNQQINTLINDSALEVKSLGFGIKRMDTILYVDTPSVVTQTVIKTKYVPYDSAKANVNLGEFDITTSNVHTDTVMARGSLGLHLHGTGGKGIMVGAGGGGNITFDDYPTSVTGDSVLSTNSSGGLVRYNLKDKLADYLLKADTSILFDSINLKLNIVDTSNIRLRPIAGDNMAITGTYPNLTFSATGGGGSPTSATDRQVLYKGGGDILKGAANVQIDSTDGRLVFPYNNDTSQVLTSYTGGNKVYTRNTIGRTSVMVVDTSSIPYALQGALNAQQYSSVVPNVTIAGNFSVARDGLFFNAAATSIPVNGTTYTLAHATYNATNTQSNYARGVVPTAAGAGSITGLRTTLGAPVGIICPTSKHGRGGGRGTFMFSLPAYAATQFFYYGYHDNASASYVTPSTFFNISNSVGIGKDVTDTELQFMWSSSFPTGVQKVSTGITPNSEDVYRITVYISPVSDFYIQLEVINNNAPTIVRIYKVPSTDPNKPIPPGRKLMFAYFIGNGVTAGAVSYGLIKLTEEIY